jgi:hypothetical protein
MNLNPVITQQFNNNLRSSMRFYFSRYEYEQTLLKDADKSPYYYDFFQQDFYRAENQTDINLPARNFLSVGAGAVKENLIPHDMQARDQKIFSMHLCKMNGELMRI